MKKVVGIMLMLISITLTNTAKAQDSLTLHVVTNGVDDTTPLLYNVNTFTFYPSSDGVFWGDINDIETSVDIYSNSEIYVTFNTDGRFQGYYNTFLGDVAVVDTTTTFNYWYDSQGYMTTYGFDYYYAGSTGAIVDTLFIPTPTILPDTLDMIFEGFDSLGLAYNSSYQFIYAVHIIFNDIEADIDDVELTKFNLYPNPASNNIQIKTTTNLPISIYNLMGELIATKTTTNNVVNFNISKLPAGVYIATDGKTHQKFIKE